ncbi:MAG: histidine kinase dimerization/phosphoacceptor domain -containing protein [Bryobacteraceae bacterium]
MTREDIRSWLKNDALSSLTAFFFCMLPAVVALSGLVLTTRFLRAHLPDSAGWVGLLRLSVVPVVAVLVALATVRVRRILEGIRREGERYRVALESAADGILLADRAGRVLEANAAAREMLGCSRTKPLGLALDELARGCAQRGGPALLPEILSSKTTLRECQLRQADGAPRTVELHGRTLEDGRIMIIIRDITARRRAEESLKVSELRYRLLFKGDLAGVYRATAGGCLLECNQSFASMLGCSTPGEVLAHDPEDFFSTPDGFHSLADLLREKRSVAGLELCRRRRDGTPVWVLESAYLSYDEALAEEVIQGTVIDITERRRAEETVRSSLSEKEALLKEVHHRVKNNLQVISSLLSLQAEEVGDPSLLSIFRESQNRIKSIALLHEGLYQSEDLARIDFGTYLQTLGQQLSSAFGADRSGIRLRVEADPVHLCLERAVPCALVVNELVSNALKHAFPHGAAGEIYVILRSGDGGRITVTVGDTGVGLPEGFSLQTSTSLGLRLLGTLVRQLKGSVDYSTGGGTEFRVSFSKVEA